LNKLGLPFGNQKNGEEKNNKKENNKEKNNGEEENRGEEKDCQKDQEKEVIRISCLFSCRALSNLRPVVF